MKFAEPGIESRRRTQSGLTLLELIVAFAILLVLSMLALPLAALKVRAQRERMLQQDLEELTRAIDHYKDYCDAGKIPSAGPDTYCYPPTLESLVAGVELANTMAGLNQRGKVRFLRRIPKDPFTGSADWGLRSMQDAPASTSWGGQNVFSVYSHGVGSGRDGVPYAEW